MPLKASPSPQMINLTQAQAIVAELQSKGVPVTNLREISPAGVASVSDPDYVDDGGLYQFVANVWGADEELGLIRAELGTGGLNVFMKLAQSGTYNQNPSKTIADALSLIVNLPPVMAAIEAALKL